MAEETQMILSAAEFLDTETILEHLPFLSPDEIDTVMENRQAEEMQRFEQAMAMQGMNTEGAEGMNTTPGAENAEGEETEGEDADLEGILAELEGLLADLGE